MRGHVIDFALRQGALKMLPLWKNSPTELQFCKCTDHAIKYATRFQMRTLNYRLQSASIYMHIA